MVTLSPEQVAEAERMWSAGCRAAGVAAFLGLTTRQLQHARDLGRVNMPTRLRGVGGGQSRCSRDPTPGEIAVACLQIKRTWSRFERLNRRSGSGGVYSDLFLANDGIRHGRVIQERGVEPIS